MLVIAFASNFLWVMVIGLLGPSLPSMISDLGMNYAQAGFLFTLPECVFYVCEVLRIIASYILYAAGNAYLFQVHGLAH